MLGHGDFAGDTMIADGGINFTPFGIDTFGMIRNFGFSATEAQICDSNGNLLFFFNGLLLDNKQNHIMLNSDSINSGPFNGNIWNYQGGTIIDEGAVAIPHPSSSNLHDLFYENIHFDSILGYPSYYLRFSQINMKLDSGLGAVIPGKKELAVITDTLQQGAIAACKHGNGRDWWVVVPKLVSGKFFLARLTPDSIYVTTQTSGIAFKMVNYGKWASFSPDGSKFAYMVSDFNDTDSIEVMNFDRCSGQFSNPQVWRLPNTYGVSCCFSPDSRFLYVVQQLNLYQYDTYASDISNSLIKVDTFDGYSDPNTQTPATFAESIVAPDGKIYVGTWNSVKVMGVINQPDSLGKDCDFTQHSVALSFYNFTVPYYPNYDLGPISESDCDSLTSINKTNDDWKFNIFPNPVTHWLNIQYQSDENLQCQLYDITGRIITHFTLYPYFKSRMYDMGNLMNGIYILHAEDEKGQSVSKKIVKE